MRQMNARSTNKSCANNSSGNSNTEHTNKKQPKSNQPPRQESEFSLTKLLKDSDTALILGLLLVLFSENADKRLLFALIYILL